MSATTAPEAIADVVSLTCPGWRTDTVYGLDLQEWLESPQYNVTGPTVLIVVGAYEPVGDMREGGKYKWFRENYGLWMRTVLGSKEDMPKVHALMKALVRALNGHTYTDPDEGVKTFVIGSGTPEQSAGFASPQIFLTVQ